MTYIVKLRLASSTMSALTVKDCIGYLKYVLTELIPIARHTNMHVLVDEIIILKDYVSLINETNLSIGTILYLLVNDCMILLIQRGEHCTKEHKAGASSSVVPGQYCASSCALFT